MDEAGALVGGDEVGLEHRVPPRPVVGDVVEGRVVPRPGQRRAGEAVENLGALAEHPLDERRGHDQHLVGRCERATYSISGPTATAAFVISVQGVVVQTSRASPASSGDFGSSTGSLT